MRFSVQTGVVLLSVFPAWERLSLDVTTVLPSLHISMATMQPAGLAGDKEKVRYITTVVVVSKIFHIVGLYERDEEILILTEEIRKAAVTLVEEIFLLANV